MQRPNPLRQEANHATSPLPPRSAASFNPRVSHVHSGLVQGPSIGCHRPIGGSRLFFETGGGDGAGSVVEFSLLLMAARRPHSAMRAAATAAMSLVTILILTPAIKSAQSLLCARLAAGNDPVCNYVQRLRRT